MTLSPEAGRDGGVLTGAQQVLRYTIHKAQLVLFLQHAPVFLICLYEIGKLSERALNDRLCFTEVGAILCDELDLHKSAIARIYLLY